MRFHTLMKTAVPGSPAYIHSAHRHVVIGPNKGINKAVAKGPIVMITAVKFDFAMPDKKVPTVNND